MNKLTPTFALTVSLLIAPTNAFTQETNAPKGVEDNCQNGTAYAEVHIGKSGRGTLTLNDTRISPSKSAYKRLFHLDGPFKDAAAANAAMYDYCNNQTVPNAQALLANSTTPRTYLHATLNENGDILRKASLHNRGTISSAIFHEGSKKTGKAKQSTPISTEIISDYAQTGTLPTHMQLTK